MSTAGVLTASKVPIAKTLRLRECGLDERWLQNQIFENAGSLGLGELEALSKEQSQSSGGRLDLLLKDPDDDSMYEVEVMLGETDEKHIVRTIEYWDNERPRWPLRQHYAVLVAESITRRFFNVIQLLSQSIPIIAIQANLIEADGSRALNFTKVLDVYEEPLDMEESGQPASEEYWLNKSPWTLQTAKILLDVIKPVWVELGLHYTKNYISLRANYSYYFWLQKLAGDKCRMNFNVLDEDVGEAEALLGEHGIASKRGKNHMRITVDEQGTLSHAEMFRAIARLARKFAES